MSDNVLQFTLREMRQFFTNPRTWIAISLVSPALAFLSLFEFMRDQSFSERLIFWFSVISLTFPIGSFFGIFVSQWAGQRGLNRALAAPFGGLLSALPNNSIVWGMGWMLAETPVSFLRLLPYSLVISVIIAIIFYLVLSAQYQAFEQQDNIGASSSRAPFFNRLPKALGKDLISLQAQDHYVEAVTTKGKHLVLIRLSDAEKELEGFNGLRSHRSWWVGEQHIDQIERKNGKMTLRLNNGQSVPVSRSYAKAIKKRLESR